MNLVGRGKKLIRSKNVRPEDALGRKRSGQPRAGQSTIVLRTPQFPFATATSYLDLNFEIALQVRLATFFTCH